MVKKIRSLADAIRLARCSRAWTQDECATRADVSRSLIADIECGRTPMVKQLTASKLERALRISLARYVTKRSA